MQFANFATLVLNQSPINTIRLLTQFSWSPKFVLSGDPLYFVTKIGMTYCEKKPLLKFEAKGREFSKNFEITRTIYSTMKGSNNLW